MTKQTKRLVYGYGINDLDEPIKVNGRHLKFYSTWRDMIRRCYSKKCQAKQPTYRGCLVCPDWLSLSNFKEWFNINYREGMELDKDILIQGNKVYCPEACSFVPRYINSLLCDSGAIRGDYPLGVVAMKPSPKTGRINATYEARCCDGHGKRITKVFKTIPEARQWYVTTKKKVANEQAVRAFGASDITSDVYQALITREW